jgi:hypothetical protein
MSLMAKIDSAVNCGLITCITPAEKSRTPTAQKVNHLPISAISGSAPGCIIASMATDAEGRTSRRKRTAVRYTEQNF